MRRKPKKRPRPQLRKISEEMKAWSAALQMELRSWPDVTLRPMFGLFGVYRRDKIFAVLPRTRTMDAPNSIGFKIPSSGARLVARARKDVRVHFPEGGHPRWLSFELSSATDLRDAMDWLNQAYEEASPGSEIRKKKQL